ncbi:MAG: hypothetical protein CSYNP_01656 [Syntrophus sp. SKADARSKE-3]|nr:hypothetical protein [Syntrophus sp. SKADARSKE-3]
MDAVKKDDVFCCADCGLEVIVNKACTCINPELTCCGGPMVRKDSSSDQAKGGTEGKATR